MAWWGMKYLARVAVLSILMEGNIAGILLLGVEGSGKYSVFSIQCSVFSMRGRGQGFVAVLTIWCRPGAVGIKFLEDTAAFWAEFNERAWGAESRATFLAVRRGPFS
jgi:hypothetical protein